MYTCIDVLHVYMYTCIHVLHVYMYTCIHVYMYMNNHMHSALQIQEEKENREERNKCHVINKITPQTISKIKFITVHCQCTHTLGDCLGI